MTSSEIHKQLKTIDIDTLMSNESIIIVHDTKKHISYKANIDIIAKAVTKKLQRDGLLPIQGD